jgi:hypothetical protein
MVEAEPVNLDPVLKPYQTQKYFAAKRRVLIIEDEPVQEILTLLMDRSRKDS